MLKLKKVILSDVRVAPCGIRGESGLTWNKNGTGLELYYVPECDFVLVRREGFNDELVNPSTCLKLELAEPYEAQERTPEGPPPPPTPAQIAAKKEVKRRKAEITKKGKGPRRS